MRPVDAARRVPVSFEQRYSALAEIASRQLGCFTVAQAHAVGFPLSGVYERVARREWAWAAKGVLRVAAGPPVSWRERALAACLSVGGVASYRTAAALFGLVPPPLVPDVVVARRARGVRRPGLHTTLDLPPSDVVRVGPVPATAPARTLVDLGAVVPESELTTAVDAALVRVIVRAERLERRARELRAPGRPGAARVLALLGTRHPQLERARNEWEARMLRLVRRFGLPDPVPNYPIEVTPGKVRILDLAWVEERVFAEFDGFEPHSGRAQFDDDRERQNEVVASGWTPFRFTSTAIARHAEAAFRPLVDTLAARGTPIRRRVPE
jgi:hypothetical protein